VQKKTIKQEVIFLLEEFNASGGLKIITSIANTLAESGMIVSFMIPKYSKEPFYPLDKSINLISVGLKLFGGKIAYFLLLYFRVRRSHCVLVTPNYRIAAICNYGFKPNPGHLIFIIQGEDAVSLIQHSSSNRLVKWMNGKMLLLSQKVIADRVYVSDFLLKKSNNKGVHIPNYVSDLYLNSPKRKLLEDKYITIGTVSTSSPNKSFTTFLSCIKKLMSYEKNQGKSFRFLCATQDAVLRDSHQNEGIEFFSPKSEKEMSKFYQSCDFLLSCSISEGFNLPVLEAMATGCIVVCTNDGGVTDFIDNKINGFILETRDPMNIADFLIELILEKEILKEMQGLAIQKAKQFNRTVFNEAYLNYFSHHFIN
jgi:glycosyltransferase involved in cell wall biosynthesis